MYTDRVNTSELLDIRPSEPLVVLGPLDAFMWGAIPILCVLFFYVVIPWFLGFFMGSPDINKSKNKKRESKIESYRRVNNLDK